MPLPVIKISHSTDGSGGVSENEAIARDVDVGSGKT